MNEKLIRWSRAGERLDLGTHTILRCSSESRYFRPLLKLVRQLDRGPFTFYKAEVYEGSHPFVVLTPKSPRGKIEMTTKIDAEMLNQLYVEDLALRVESTVRKQYASLEATRQAFIAAAERKAAKKKIHRRPPLSKFF